MEGEKLELEVLTKEKDAQAIREAIAEAEKELDKDSQAEVGKMMFLPPEVAKGIRKFVVEVGVEFAKYFAKKYGESLADWLARKLGLQESKGEGVSESG